MLADVRAERQRYDRAGDQARARAGRMPEIPRYHGGPFHMGFASQATDRGVSREEMEPDWGSQGGKMAALRRAVG